MGSLCVPCIRVSGLLQCCSLGFQSFLDEGVQGVGSLFQDLGLSVFRNLNEALIAHFPGCRLFRMCLGVWA